MLGYLTLLLVCQLIGESLAVVLAIPLPGPLIGMAVLFVIVFAADALGARGVVDGTTEAADALLRHLSLLFVPAGVGVVLHLALIREEWLSITLALIGSAVLTTLVTGWVMQRLGPAEPPAGGLDRSRD